MHILSIFRTCCSIFCCSLVVREKPNSSSLLAISGRAFDRTVAGYLHWTRRPNFHATTNFNTQTSSKPEGLAAVRVVLFDCALKPNGQVKVKWWLWWLFFFRWCGCPFCLGLIASLFASPDQAPTAVKFPPPDFNRKSVSHQPKRQTSDQRECQNMCQIECQKECQNVG